MGRVSRMDDHIVPPYRLNATKEGSRWKVIRVVEDLKVKVKKRGLWNFFAAAVERTSKVGNTFNFEATHQSRIRPLT